MTNFQLITQNATTLDDFISAVVDDALAAKGCSMELKLPYELQEGAGGVFLQWKEWLEQENEDECIYLGYILVNFDHRGTLVAWVVQVVETYALQKATTIAEQMPISEAGT